MTSLRGLVGRGWIALESRANEAVRGARQWALGGVATIDDEARIYASARLEPLSRDPSSIVIGGHTHVRGQLLTAAHGGRIVIGEWGYIGEGTRIWSAAEVTIGDRVLVSHG